MLKINGRIESFQKFRENYSWIITDHEYSYWNGIIIPKLVMKQRESVIFVPFIGPKYFVLSSEVHCNNCLEARENLSWNGLCTECREHETQKQYACIYTRAGKPFGGQCDPATSAICNNESFCQSNCNVEYVIYLGRFGKSLKVGITRLYKGNSEDGYKYRIISQGFDFAIVFKGITPINLVWAQRLEEEISQYFNIPLKLGFHEKIQNLSALETSVSNQNLHEITQLIEEAFPEIINLEIMSFKDDYWWFNQKLVDDKGSFIHYPVIRHPDIVAGEVIMTRGELALLEKEDIRYWINLRDLQGRSFYQWED